MTDVLTSLFQLINLVSTSPARAFPGPDSTFRSGSASWTGLTKSIKGWTLFVTHLQVLNMAVLNLCSVNEVVVTMQILQGFKNHIRTLLSVLNSFFIVLASVPPIISSCLPKEHGWEVKVLQSWEGDVVRRGSRCLFHFFLLVDVCWEASEEKLTQTCSDFHIVDFVMHSSPRLFSCKACPQRGYRSLALDAPNGYRQQQASGKRGHLSFT